MKKFINAANTKNFKNRQKFLNLSFIHFTLGPTAIKNKNTITKGIITEL